jgi:hypothetical protein
LIEWPEGETGPSKYFFSALPPEISLATLVDIVNLRWRIERDYEELKSELSLAHYEGRGWRGFQHHATLCIAAYGFLIRERAAFSPSARLFGQASYFPDRPRPRGAPGQAGAPCGIINRDAQKKHRRRSRQNSQAMSMLSNHGNPTI